MFRCLWRLFVGRGPQPGSRACRPTLEVLEDRATPSAASLGQGLAPAWPEARLPEETAATNQAVWAATFAGLAPAAQVGAANSESIRVGPGTVVVIARDPVIPGAFELIATPGRPPLGGRIAVVNLSGQAMNVSVQSGRTVERVNVADGATAFLPPRRGQTFLVTVTPVGAGG